MYATRRRQQGAIALNVERMDGDWKIIEMEKKKKMNETVEGRRREKKGEKRKKRNQQTYVEKMSS